MNLRIKLKVEKTLNEVLPEAFAYVREALVDQEMKGTWMFRC